MPRLKNQPMTYNPVRQRKSMNQIISIAMIRRGIQSNVQLAELIGMSKSSFSARWVGEARWTYPELYKLVQVLQLTADEILKMMGGPAA